ncbi:hypothetical protein D3C81_2111570 [compost metagenome]
MHPGIQHPLRLVAVIALQAFKLGGILELFTGFADAGQRAVFHEFLGGFGDDAHAALRKRRGNRHRHATAHAMAKRDEARQ